ncbi:MAG: methylated-DNA--[protein]-cysteine S-methyltransferase [Candidatus Wallbacteria bacterium]|nr:methylated-DNA--[protein]-cysteine S-methyltransferase [Candidatus Wallbacteria bacterium]
MGDLRVVATGAALVGIYFEGHDPEPELGAVPAARHEVLDRAEEELAEYFRGERRSFAVPLEFRGTPFQQAVWRALGAIPFGETRTYGELARQLGRPGAARAVGAANRVNPFSIVVPCHRVVGASGELTGYAGGLDRKRWLLEHERGGES